MNTRKVRSEELPLKFSAAERRAYDWLYESGSTAWVVDLLTKKVKTASREWDSLIEFARHKGMK